MNTDNLRQVLRGEDWTQDPFQVLRLVSIACRKSSTIGRELVIRTLERRADLKGWAQSVVDELAMAVGLHPYVGNLDELSFQKTLLHAAHRAEGLLGDVVFHSSQRRVFEALLSGKSVILSAPTSYGKSLLIDAVIAARKFACVVLIVPTIALIEETRRRMTRFSPEYRVITNSSQSLGAKNIFVLTQERYTVFSEEIPNPDFFAIDEFYKLSIETEGARSNTLNQVFRSLASTGSQFYLLGPSIHSIPDVVQRRLACEFLVEDFHTVATEIKILPKRPNRYSRVAELLGAVGGQTLIYCKSPASARKLAAQLLGLGIFARTDHAELIGAAKWAATNYHEDWLVAKVMEFGLGIHHGKIPRALGRFMIRMFEERKIRCLLCTSTLIEGVNTNARNVVVYDHKISSSDLDVFTFNNIKGRSGRMFRHFVGRVFVFQAPPQAELPFVDIPAFNPSKDSPTSLLLQIPEEQLPAEARVKVRSVLAQDLVRAETFRAHSSIEPEVLINTAQFLVSLPTSKLSKFSWSGVSPDYYQLESTSQVIWTQMEGKAAAIRSGVFSAEMMTFWVWDLLRQRNIARFRKKQIASQIEQKRKPDDAVEQVLAFLRNWAGFSYPRYLTALSDVLAGVFQRRQLGSCDYSAFAASVENLFQPPSFTALEEYGLPSEIAKRLMDANLFGRSDGFDQVLGSLKAANLSSFPTDEFEASVIRDFIDGLA